MDDFLTILCLPQVGIILLSFKLSKALLAFCPLLSNPIGPAQGSKFSLPLNMLCRQLSGVFGVASSTLPARPSPGIQGRLIAERKQKDGRRESVHITPGSFISCASFLSSSRTREAIRATERSAVLVFNPQELAVLRVSPHPCHCTSQHTPAHLGQ